MTVPPGGPQWPPPQSPYAAPYPPPYGQGDPPPYAQPHRLPPTYPPPCPMPYLPPPPRRGRGGLVAGLIAAAVAVVVLVSLTGVALYRVTAAPRPAATPAAGTPPVPGANTGVARGEVGITDEHVQALLDAQASALRGKAETAFLSRYDAGNAALVASQRMLFDNLTKIPFDHVDFATHHRVVPPSGGGGPVSVTVDVAFVHQITGVDVKPVFEWYRWGLTRRAPGAPLTISSVTGATSAYGSADYVFYPAPWDVAPLTVIRGHRVLILANAQTAAMARRLIRVAEVSAGQDLRAWGNRPGVPSGFLMMFESFHNRFAAYYGLSLGGGFGAYSFTMPAFVQGGVPSTVGGNRIVIDTNAYDYSSRLATGDVFVHEMAHAIAATAGSNIGKGPPAWVVEGFATYMEIRTRPAARDLGSPSLASYVRDQFTGHLPTNGDVYSISGAVASANYVLSMLAFRFIAERFGDAKCFDLVVRAYENPTQEDVVAILEELTGMSLAAFEAQWAAFVRQTVASGGD